MQYAEMMATDPPRLVVRFGKAQNGDEVFDWGLVGQIPLLSLIGAVSRAVTALNVGGWLPECDERVLVLAMDAATKHVEIFAHPDLPGDPLVGMLETVKAVLVGSRMAQHAAAQMTRVVGPTSGKLMGPDGRPI